MQLRSILLGYRDRELQCPRGGLGAFVGMQQFLEHRLPPSFGWSRAASRDRRRLARALIRNRRVSAEGGAADKRRWRSGWESPRWQSPPRPARNIAPGR